MKLSFSSKSLFILPRLVLIAGLISVPALSPLAMPHALAAPATLTDVRISIFVIDDLARKPVPLTDFRFIRGDDETAVEVARTNESGALKIALAPGDYTFESASPVHYKSRVISWKKSLHVNKDGPQAIVYTDGDGTTTVEPPAPVPAAATPSVAAPVEGNQTAVEPTTAAPAVEPVVPAAIVSATVVSTAPHSAANKIDVTEGTKIRLELSEPLASNRAKKGEEVRLFLKDAVLGANNEVLIPEHAAATGLVTYSKGAGTFGKKGKLEFSIDSIKAADGTKIPLRSSQVAGGKNNLMGGAVGIILFGPLMGFVKGKNITLDQGTLFDAYIDKTVAVAPLVTPAPSSAVVH